MTWWMWLLGAGGWVVAAALVAFGAGRLIAAADRATRPETASDASEHGLRTTTPDRTRPDAGDPSQRPESASPDDSALTADAFIDRYYTPGLVSPPAPAHHRKDYTQ